VEIREVLTSNYLPYAKGTIISRAIPAIDGLKPAQRRILYTMYKLGLQKGNKSKSSRIVGETMKLHPHGDMAIYETMVKMSSGHEALNVPYIESKGNFGKIYSKDLTFAAPRYTEAKLADICVEVMDGLEEGAVNFVNNFDDTMREPELLPVKFPSVLVNTTSGIAVSTSSYIPSFNLERVCDATVKVINGEITDESQLMDVLRNPEFPTGGYLHADKESLDVLGKTGRNSFTVSGKVTLYKDKIIINEIPYRTSVEAIISTVEELVKNGEFKEISDIRDETDLSGFKLIIELKRGANVQEVINKMYRMTTLRMHVSFNCRVIINDRCEELGLLDLINKWVEFRKLTISRIYNHRLSKANEQEHLLSSWEKIGNLRDVVDLLTSKNEKEATADLMSMYGLDKTQAEYILDIRIKGLTKDNVKNKLDKLEEVRKNILDIKDILDSDDKKKDKIVSELTGIKGKYRVEKKTSIAKVVTSDDIKEKEEVDESIVTVVVSNKGQVKRFTNFKDLQKFELEEKNADVYLKKDLRNTGYLLVFLKNGDMHKIQINTIDASKGVSYKDRIIDILKIRDIKEVAFIDATDSFEGRCNIVFGSGRGIKLNYERFSGNRIKYKFVSEEDISGGIWITNKDKFFIITKERKAAYMDASDVGLLSSRAAFKVARIKSGDSILGVLPADKAKGIESVDLDKYTKGYTVKLTDKII